MQAETIRQALEKLDELEALVDNDPGAFQDLHYDFFQPVKRIRKALLKELNYAEIDLLGGLIQVTR
jgi:hypothetical protein